MTKYDAVIVGSGPNGLVAAITLAQAGCSVLVVEGADEVGGGVRSDQITLPGFIHDICSAIHPLVCGSPAMRALPLARHGLRWIHAPYALAHPLDGSRVSLLSRSLAATSYGLGEDGPAYQRLMGPLIDAWKGGLDATLLGPLRPMRDPLSLARFGLDGILPAEVMIRNKFRTEEAQALLAGIAAHSVLPLSATGSAAFGLVLGALAHVVGWPFPEGGAQRITDALVACLRELGGEIVTGSWVADLANLSNARAVLLDVSPRQMVAIAGGQLPGGYRRKLERFKYGPGVFKVDWALDAPVPWSAPACAQAATVHVGGTLDEVARSEQDAWKGVVSDQPFVLVAQQSLFDPSRAPDGKQTLWAYCHVPNGCAVDMTDAIERQIERFAPGFRDRILARSVCGPAAMERYNPNYIGGDIGGGANTLDQLFARPVSLIDPYATPLPGVYLCSASTPPGGGVHGMCGYHAAKSALRQLRVRPDDRS